MLEIILIVFLCKAMGAKLRAKGWEKPFWMQFLVVVTYLGSLLCGSFGYAMYVAFTQGDAALEGLGISLYLAAYVGVAVGVGALFLVVSLLQAKPVPQAAIENGVAQ